MSEKSYLYGKSRTIPILKTELEIISWLKRGKVRLQVFQNIDKRTMPSEIVRLLSQKRRRISSSYYAQVGRALKELKEQKLIVCLNPDEKTGRFYCLTLLGRKIKNSL